MPFKNISKTGLIYLFIWRATYEVAFKVKFLSRNYFHSWNDLEAAQLWVKWCLFGIIIKASLSSHTFVHFTFTSIQKPRVMGSPDLATVSWRNHLLLGSSRKWTLEKFKALYNIERTMMSPKDNCNWLKTLDRQIRQKTIWYRMTHLESGYCLGSGCSVYNCPKVDLIVLKLSEVKADPESKLERTTDCFSIQYFKLRFWTIHHWGQLIKCSGSAIVSIFKKKSISVNKNSCGAVEETFSLQN